METYRAQTDLLDKTPLMKRVEAQIGRELHDELKRNIDRGHTACHTAVCLNVSPTTVTSNTFPLPVIAPTMNWDPVSYTHLTLPTILLV